MAAAPPRARRDAVTPDDAAVSGDQGGQSGLPVVLPDGRFLRAVLPGRRDREPRARHRADQARQAPGRRHSDVRRAGGALGRVSAQADRRGLPRRGVRADRGPGGGEEARRQERGRARRHAADHRRHPDRRHAARRAAQQLSGGDRARARLVARCRAAVRARLARYFHRRVPRDGVRPPRARRRDRPHRAGRDHRVRRALWRSRARALAAHAPGDAAHPRRVRRRDRRAAARGLLCGRHHRSPSARSRGWS